LYGRDYWRLLKLVEAATQLGAPDAVLGVWPRGVYLFAADDLVSPSWWFDGAFGWRRMRTQSHRALVAPPAEIAYALSRVGGNCRIEFRKDRVRFLSAAGAAEVTGRVVPTNNNDVIPASVYNHGPIFALVQFDVEQLRRAVSGAGARGIFELRLIHGLGVDHWEAYAVNEGGERVPLQAKTVAEPEREIIGRYRAATLSTMLSLRTERYLGILFTGSPEVPTLFADWREIEMGIDIKFLIRPLS